MINICFAGYQKQEAYLKQSMDNRTANYQSNESESLSLESVDKETTMDAIESVASKLRNIGDNLNQSYEKLPASEVGVANAPCAVWEGCLDLCVLVVKTTR